MAAQYINEFSVDLYEKPRVRMGGDIAFEGNNQANIIRVSLYSNGTAYSGGGTVTATAIRTDGSTVPMTGSISGNVATITLNANCYLYPGMLTVSVQLNDTNTVTTILAIIYKVVSTEGSGDPIDPSSEITANVNTLLTAIENASSGIPALQVGVATTSEALTFLEIS